MNINIFNCYSLELIVQVESSENTFSLRWVEILKLILNKLEYKAKQTKLKKNQHKKRCPREEQREQMWTSFFSFVLFVLTINKDTGKYAIVQFEIG